MRTVRIGAGAGFSGDRIDSAVELAAKGSVDWLVFECLAERTIALAQKERLLHPDAGYDPFLEERMEAVLPLCAKQGIGIVSNMGAANPVAAARRTMETARRLGLFGLRIAAVTGDDVLSEVRNLSPDELQGVPRQKLIAANAYLGAEPIARALAEGADVVLTGRVADPSMFVGILMHEFGWPADDWNLLGQGTLVGHLMECAGQLTGGYFADPGYGDVPDLAHLGFPIAEVAQNGNAAITKVEGSGGLISRATCTEQLLYEIQDPAAYVTPDVVADFSGVSIEGAGANRICVRGGSGKPRPEFLKVSVGFHDGYVAEGQVSYAGPGALARAQLAREILSQRLRGYPLDELRFDLIGVNAIAGDVLPIIACPPQEVRLRAAGRSESRHAASMIPREVEALYTNGPAAGGGVVQTVRDSIGVVSVSIPRSAVAPVVQLEVS